MKKRYKFLRTGLKSDNGDVVWKIGEWRKEDAVDICKSGFHCSKEPFDAFRYVAGEILAEVEVRGASVIEKDKEAWSEMRIVKAWKWKKEDSVALTIFSAEGVLHLFEKKYPEDKRPREAIDAAKKWLGEPTEENRAATWAAEAAEEAAWAAWAAEEAAAAAWAAWAAEAAEAAAWAAEAEEAAQAAAEAAQAAEAAEAAEAAAAEGVVVSWNKLNDWMLKRIKTLEPLKP